jgi:CheY-like chemotaxis protein
MNPARILVVEDNPMNMELAQELLEIEGFEVLPAQDAITGIEMARTELPDLILMDLQLPGIDGLQATRLLKEDPATSAIPVVALTAHAMNHHGAQAREAGCCAFITKPIDVEAFPQQIRRILPRVEARTTPTEDAAQTSPCLLRM